MRTFVFLAVLLLSPTVAAANPWADLSVVHVDRSCYGDVTVRYNPELLTSLENSAGINPDSQIKEGRVMAIRLAATSEPVLLDYSEGASCDPTFYVFSSAAGRDAWTPIGELWALTVIVPGDGALYATGHTNRYFNQTRKYVINDARLEEVRQPMYFAGIDTVAQQPFSLFSSPRADIAIADVAVGEEVTLVACDDQDWCLVRNRTGLLGWLELVYAIRGEEPLRGVFYAGD